MLLDLIGQGGMGRVYLARDTRLNRRVALKILSPERVNNPRAIARFQREARVGAQLQHENLVRIYDFGESNGRYFLVMEYHRRQDDRHVISEQGQIPSATAVRLVRQVAMGLEHAHRKGLIHRDVNPYNILVTRDGTAKLADLGLAIDLTEDDHVTREGATVGTFDYVAPEQARHSHSADIRSDIYSLGCSLYHMCSGQVPFPSPSLPEKLFAHQAMEATPLDQMVAGLPDGLSLVVQRMMRKSPDERYATPLQVALALEPFLREYSAAASREDVVDLRLPVATTSSESPQSDGARTTLGHPAAEFPAVRLADTNSARLKTPSDAALDPVTAPNALIAPALISTVNDQGSDPEFPSNLILSPEPSLSAGLSRPKPRSASSNTAISTEGTSAAVRLPRSWLWGLVAITAIVLILVVILAVINPSGNDTPRVAVSPPTANTTSPEKTSDVIDSKSNEQNSILKPDTAIVVRIEGVEEKEYSADKLVDAIKKAIGGRGCVELRNREPLHMTANQSLDFTSATGPLIILRRPRC